MAYDKANELRTRETDRMYFLLGHYMYEAVSTSLANAFRKKGTQAVKYREEPILEEIRKKSGNLTEAEKIAETEKIFETLEMLKRNFEMNHEGTSNGTDN